MPESDFPVSHGTGMSVRIVVGQVPGSETAAPHCGVRDYAGCLAEALQNRGIEARIVAPKSWGVRDGLSFMRELRAERPDVVHLQYPSIGQRHSLLPHLLGLFRTGRSSLVTLHEHSAMPAVQRHANRLFRAAADRIVFTTDFEANAFGAGSANPVIPIGSNIPVHPGGFDRNTTVLYFGQIRPNKGLENFARLARLATLAGENYRFLILGSVPVRWRSYAEALRNQVSDIADWVEDASSETVAQAMAMSAAAYLPFPDGAGLRRGSLIAALANGLPVIAPVAASTPSELRSIVHPAETPEAALIQLRMLRSATSHASEFAGVGRDLVRRFAWPVIAEQHVALYRLMLAEGASQRHDRPAHNGLPVRG